MNLNASLEKLFAGRWIAGYYPEDAFERAKLLNLKGMHAIINFLGETKTDRKEIKDAVSAYEGIINGIKEQNLSASISLKPTQIGLSVSYALMRSNYLRIARLAKLRGILVWLDMEEPKYVSQTINVYESAIGYGNTGICIQSYLKRSASDVESLIGKDAKIRIVKGAYRVKDRNTVFGSRRAINHNYMQIMKMLFQRSNDFMLATHDSNMIDEGIRLNKKYKKRMTIAMLNGIRSKYARYLVRHNQKVAVYVPFGKEWVAFSYRRLVEQRHTTLIIRSLLESQRL